MRIRAFEALFSYLKGSRNEDIRDRAAKMEHPMPTQTRSRTIASKTNAPAAAPPKDTGGTPAVQSFSDAGGTSTIQPLKDAGGTPALPDAFAGTQMTGAEMVIRALADQGVEHVFGYPGGAVLPIYDALFHQEKVRHVLVRHEQGAVHAAEGYARSTGKVAAVLVTSGPGATNAVTGLTDALCDSIPLVCITGQVPTHLIGNDAFQECDTVGITRPCTKHNYLVKNIADLPCALHEAFYVAASGRPGPVVVDIPKDIQFAAGTYVRPSAFPHQGFLLKLTGNIEKIKAAVALMAAAKRPLFYTGGGVINSGPAATRMLRELLRLTGFPVTSTLMGLGAVPAADPQWLGMLGMHGTYEANLAMHDCDVMVCVGARFDDRITGRLDAFAPYSRIIHIDIDPSSINKNVKVDIGIVGDCAHVLDDT